MLRLSLPSGLAAKFPLSKQAQNDRPRVRGLLEMIKSCAISGSWDRRTSPDATGTLMVREHQDVLKHGA